LDNWDGHAAYWPEKKEVLEGSDLGKVEEEN